MGSLKRKTVTRPLPTGAAVSTRRRRANAKELRQDATRQTITEQVATWRDRTGENERRLLLPARTVLAGFELSRKPTTPSIETPKGLFGRLRPVAETRPPHKRN